MTLQEFIATSTEIWTAPHVEMRYDALVRTHQAFAEKQHEVDLLKAELDLKVAHEKINLTQGQVEWLHAYFDGDEAEFPNSTIQIMNSTRGPIMFDPETPSFGWVYVEDAVACYNKTTLYDDIEDEMFSKESPAMGWVANQLVAKDQLIVEEFIDMDDETFIDACHLLVSLIEHVKTEKATPTDVRETGEICLLCVFLEDRSA